MGKEDRNESHILFFTYMYFRFFFHMQPSAGPILYFFNFSKTRQPSCCSEGQGYETKAPLQSHRLGGVHSVLHAGDLLTCCVCTSPADNGGVLLLKPLRNDCMRFFFLEEASSGSPASCAVHKPFYCPPKHKENEREAHTASSY